ncbi:hypothetical protein ANTQUA_LOCUS6933 [Anthophora quadrimaculata]
MRLGTSILPPLLTQHGIVDEIPEYRTVVAARYVSDACLRLGAFENQDSTTFAYLRWYTSRNTAPHVFPVVLVLRIELRLFYLSRTVAVARYVSERTVVAARYVSDACLRLEAFENQDSTTVAYTTWVYRPYASIQVFSGVIVQRIEMRLLYLSRTVVASEMCFRHVLSCRSVLHPGFHHLALLKMNRGCGEMCIRHVLSIEAFENQDSTTVAYTTWVYRPYASIQVFSGVIVQRIEMRLLYLSRTVVASEMCFRHVLSCRSVLHPGFHHLALLKMVYFTKYRTTGVSCCSSAKN